MIFKMSKMGATVDLRRVGGKYQTYLIAKGLKFTIDISLEEKNNTGSE